MVNGASKNFNKKCRLDKHSGRRGGVYWVFVTPPPPNTCHYHDNHKHCTMHSTLDLDFFLPHQPPKQKEFCFSNVRVKEIVDHLM